VNSARYIYIYQQYRLVHSNS